LQIELTLEANACAFLEEAVRKGLSAIKDQMQWQFALLNLVQSLELSLKSRLKKAHPLLIYENIDNPKLLVGIPKALKRLEHPDVLGIEISTEDRNNIQKAIDLRNQITHADIKMSKIYAEKKYFELLAFVIYFQSMYLEIEIEGIISEELLAALLEHEISRDELYKKAIKRIEEEQVDEEWLLVCPGCSEETFVIMEGYDTCYFCRSTYVVEECKNCKRFVFGDEIISFAEEIDYDVEEGQVVVYDTFGYDDLTACIHCVSNIKEDISRQREEKEYEYQDYMQYLRDYSGN
jgi:hypothetical protein